MAQKCSTQSAAKVGVAALLVLVSFALAYGKDIAVKLTGDQEVPPVSTAASGVGTISINADKSVKGSLTTTGIAGTMAHIHLGGPGKNGPPIITLVKSGDNVWSVPDGAKLTDDQYKSFTSGELYVNVHSDAHKGGEIRAQLKP
jgi:CHRD domain